MDPSACDALVQRVRLGERECYRILVDELEGEVRGFVAVRASSHELIKEIVQAAFVEAYCHLDAYELRGTFSAWVKGFARNLLQRELALRARQTSTDIEVIESLLAAAALNDLENNEAMLERRQIALDHLDGCLEQLAPRAQLLARRRFADQVSINALAQQFKQTRAAIANSLTRIRARLRACVEEAALRDKRQIRDE